MRIPWGTLRTPVEDLEETFMKVLDILEDQKLHGAAVVVDIYLETEGHDA